jgi:trehalose 6-phosphate synthase
VSRVNASSRFVVVANRLPVDRAVDADGRTSWQRSPGGLVTALEPVLQRNHGVWLGWSGAPDEDIAPFEADGMTLVPVRLSATEVEEYYEGFSNTTLWPLYHDAIVPPRYRREWWDAYVKVNRRFAEQTARHADDGAVVWVQDYQLQLVPAMLRELRPDLRIGFFLHIPFPPTELFSQLPWRQQIVEGLLGADLVGFQRPGGASNFARLARRYEGVQSTRDGIVLDDGRTVHARAFPISIEVRGLDELARSEPVEKRAAEIREDLGNPKHVLLGVDRLDYTKGIRQRLRAFGELLRDGEITPAEAVFVQVASPSRDRVEEYRTLRDEIERLVGRINGDYGELGQPAVHYLHTSYGRDEMAALFRASDVMVVTPLRDGMNLVAKEYVACRVDQRGCLVLSEFAGAADELTQAFLVNPHDLDGLKRTMLAAMNVSPDDERRRMRAMRRYLARHDVNRWAEEFLSALTATDGNGKSEPA